jgi:hypothetical protein
MVTQKSMIFVTIFESVFSGLDGLFEIANLLCKKGAETRGRWVSTRMPPRALGISFKKTTLIFLRVALPI